MNLRIAPEHIRFRISEAEFNTLITHGVLINSTTLGSTGHLDYSILVHPNVTSVDGQILDLTRHLCSDGMVLELSLFAHGIEQLKNGIAGKDGIQEHLAFDNGAMLRVLRNQIYRRLFTAQIVALLGTGLATVALGLLAAAPRG